MYDIRQFKPTLYVLVAMGITGFAMACDAPGLWLLAMFAVGINAWLLKTRRFHPMPRLLANIVTLGSLAFVTLEIRAGDTTPIITIGEFLVLLHLVKLYEQRANRDYAQLLVLSLLLMVAASISTASLFFGLTLIVYLFVSLYCCLLFHLKVETDHARAAFGNPDERLNPSTLKQDQRYLPRSMRRLTGLVSTVAITMAVIVFLFFPRGTGAGMFGPLQFRPSQTLTGFSDQVSFQKIAQITRNEDVVARVQVFQGENIVAPTKQLLLRGTTLDVYSGNDVSRGGQWLWSRSQSLPGDDEMYIVGPDEPRELSHSAPRYRQEITLQPTGTLTLFALAGPVRFATTHDVRLRFSRRDGVLQSADPLIAPIEYTVTSSGQLPPNDAGDVNDGWRRSNIDPKITEFAHRPDVCGVDPAGKPLADHPMAGDHAFDKQIAGNFEHYLRTEFRYTLDLTDAKHINGQDPVVAFLYDLKRGHCEYFAGAMTLLCQSIGLPARMVVGFRCDAEDYNNLLGGYYVVKQSNAHAWCEVYTGQQWDTFDPTSGRETEAGKTQPWFAGAKKFLDFLEYKWANSVVAYDRADRKNLMDSLNTSMTKTAVTGSQNVSDFSTRLNDWWRKAQWTVSTQLIGGVIALMLLVLLIAVIWFFFERLRMRRRARRIGLETLPLSDQQRLVRQLGFYDDLLRILERHHIVRPRHLTPLEFSENLSFLPSDVYDDIRRLTGLYYRIRYGTSGLNPHRHRHLATVISRVQHAMDLPRTILPPDRIGPNPDTTAPATPL